MTGMAPGDVPTTFADIEHARTRLGYNPSTTIDVGLHRCCLTRASALAPQYTSWSSPRRSTLFASLLSVNMSLSITEAIRAALRRYLPRADSYSGIAPPISYPSTRRWASGTHPLEAGSSNRQRNRRRKSERIPSTSDASPSDRTLSRELESGQRCGGCVRWVRAVGACCGCVLWVRAVGAGSTLVHAF